MVFRAAFFLLPLALLPSVTFAQSAPPEVEKALRDRVTEFFQYHVDGEFEKAYDMVAANTRKYYFGAQKLQFKTFKIDSVAFSDNFTKATVTLTCEQMVRMRLEFPETLVTVPMSTTWMVENGKWVWYRDVVETWLTPMGKSDPEAIKKKPNDSGKPDLSAAAIAERAQAILQQTNGLNKNELKLVASKVSSDEVTFHNGQPGQIRISLMTTDLPSGMTATLDKKDLNGGDNAVLKVHYDPPPDTAQPQNVMLQLIMEPFGRRLPILVKFDTEN